MTPGVTTAWLADLAAAGQQVATRRRKLAAALSFYRYGAAEGVPVTEPKPHPGTQAAPRRRRHRRPRHGPGPPALEATTGRPPYPRPDRRPAVLRPADRRSPHPPAGRPGHPAGATVLRVARKGGKPRTAVLPALAVLAIHDWLAQRGDHPGPLFTTSTGQPVDPRAAHRLLGRLGKTAGIAGPHPHTLRHTLATTAVDVGSDVLKVATALATPHSRPPCGRYEAAMSSRAPRYTPLPPPSSTAKSERTRQVDKDRAQSSRRWYLCGNRHRTGLWDGRVTCTLATCSPSQLHTAPTTPALRWRIGLSEQDH